MINIANSLLILIFFAVTPVIAEPSFDLWLAAKKGDYDKCVAALRKEADVNYKGPHGTTPLWQAAKNGHERVIQLLVDNGADVFAFNTPEQKRASIGNSPKMRQGSAGKKEKSISGSFILRSPLPNKERKKKNGKDAPKDGSPAREEPSSVRLKKIKEIPHKSIPLHVAVRNGHQNAVKLLLQLGDPKQIKAIDEHGNTPVHLACSSKDKTLFDTLVSLENVTNRLFSGHLLTAVNTMNNAGLFPIHVAIESDHPITRVEKLLSAGANVNAITGNDGYVTPLEMANCKLADAVSDNDHYRMRMYGYLEMLLVVRGADIHEAGLSSPLHPTTKLAGTILMSVKDSIQGLVFHQVNEDKIRTLGLFDSAPRCPLDEIFRKMTLCDSIGESSQVKKALFADSLWNEPDHADDQAQLEGEQSEFESDSSEASDTDGKGIPKDNEATSARQLSSEQH